LEILDVCLRGNRVPSGNISTIPVAANHREQNTKLSTMEHGRR